MFSVEQKRQISEAVERIILDIGHPEMPAEKPKFKLHINGIESWSWADIEPNWVFDDKKPSVNQWNEEVGEIMEDPFLDGPLIDAIIKKSRDEADERSRNE